MSGLKVFAAAQRAAESAGRDRRAVTKWILLAGAAFAASAVAKAAVPPSVRQDWYEGGRWSVGGATFTDGNKECVLANMQPGPGGDTSFALSKLGGHDPIIMFHDATIVWDASGGSATLQVDGYPSFTAQTETDTARNLLIVPLANTPGPVMTAFLAQLARGHELRVATAAAKQTFDLSGSNPALDAFGRCIAAMSSDGG